MKKKEVTELILSAIGLHKLIPRKLQEKGDTKKVKDLYEVYQEYKNKIIDRNGWTPIMYACRYGNLELLIYFNENGFSTETQGTYGLVHIASFAGELPILKYLLEVMNKDPNPPNVETTPLRFAVKYQNYECVEYLFRKGAYLVDENYIHNLIPYRTTEQKEGQTYEIVKYRGLTGVEIPSSMIFRVNEIEKARKFIRWLRVRNFLFACFVSDIHREQYEKNKKMMPFMEPKTRRNIASFLQSACFFVQFII